MLRGISLVVSDMANTILAERGIIYRSIGKTLKDMGVDFDPNDMRDWHGRDKREVLERYVEDSRAAEIALERTLDAQYFDGSVDLFDGAREWMRDLRRDGVLVALNTGYPADTQRKLVRHFRLDVDAFVSSSEVERGRPSPYMIFELMRRTRVDDVRRVAKIGDTPNDVREGKNAGCGITIGVLTGESTKEELYDAGADIVVPSVTSVYV